MQLVRLGDSVVSLSEARMLVDELMLVKEALLMHDVDSALDDVSDRIRASLYDAIIEDRRDGTSSDVLVRLIQGLIDQLQTLPVMSLTLAFHPTIHFRSQLVHVMQQQTGRRVLFEYGYDPTMIGGARIAFDGKYYDYSLESRFNAQLTTIAESIQQAMAADD